MDVVVFFKVGPVGFLANIKLEAVSDHRQPTE